MDKAQKLDFALGQFDRLQTFFNRVEGRAAFFWATDIAMATVVVSNLSKSLLYKPMVIPGLIALVALAISIGFLIAVSHSHLKNLTRPSMIYFGDIARVSADSYIDNVSATDETELLKDALCQIWRNAEILSMKYGRVQKAFLFLCIALPFWLGFLGWLVFDTGGLPMFSGD